MEVEAEQKIRSRALIMKRPGELGVWNAIPQAVNRFLGGADRIPSVRMESSFCLSAASVLMMRVAQERKALAVVTVIRDGQGKQKLELRAFNSIVVLSAVVVGGSVVGRTENKGIFKHLKILKRCLIVL